MANLTSAINVQVDSETKRRSTKILNSLGLSMSTAINIFLKQVIINDGLPFKIENKKTSKELLEALKEADDIINGKIKVKSFNNREDLKKALLSDENKM